MALEVVSVIPAENAEDVLMDASVQVEFNKPLHDLSITSANFKIYYVPNAQGQVQVSVMRDPRDSKKVNIAPVEDFPANTKFQLVVRGDHNLADSIQTGVVSEDDDVMDGNYVQYFTTGTRRYVDVDADVIYDTESGLDRLNDETGVNVQLQVIKTTPDSFEAFVTDVNNIDIEFNDVVSAIASGSLQIRGESLLYGLGVEVPTISGMTYVDNKTLRYLTDNNLSYNTEYTIAVDKDYLSGTARFNETIPDDYVFKFMGPILPYYTNPRMVRRRGGVAISEDIPDYAIWQYIMDASLWIHDQLGISSDSFPWESPEDVPYAVVMATTCKTIYEIGVAITFGRLKGIRAKRLADLHIQYDNKYLQDALDEFRHCYEDYLWKLDGGRYDSGVKSGGSKWYPKRKRPLMDGDWSRVYPYERIFVHERK